MREHNNSVFHAKILLLGEYAVVHGGKGVTVPFSKYSGQLRLNQQNLSKDQTSSHLILKKFLKYLKERCVFDKDISALNLNKLAKDLSKNLYFDSHIPQRYGIGSSGALVAALYDQYGVKNCNVKTTQILKTKNILSKMEHFFHGISSGLDPLTSYLNQALIAQPSNISLFDFSGLNPSIKFFLLDTHQVAQTDLMVKNFSKMIQEKNFKDLFYNQFIPITNQGVDALLGQNKDLILNQFKKISQITFALFSPMIPQNMRNIWQSGIDHNNYYLKLCGSGGGGYILGVTHDLQKTRDILKGQDIEIIK